MPIRTALTGLALATVLFATHPAEAQTTSSSPSVTRSLELEGSSSGPGPAGLVALAALCYLPAVILMSRRRARIEPR